MFTRARLYLSSIEGAAFVRVMRCMIAQGFFRAVLLFLLISAAGYAAFKSVDRCESGTTCATVQRGQ